MYFNRVDIVEAWYLALTHCHKGQWSDEYRRLSFMQTYFHPPVNLATNALSSNGLEIYKSAVRRLTNDSE